jgi:hypothetical protein
VNRSAWPKTVIAATRPVRRRRRSCGTGVRSPAPRIFKQFPDLKPLRVELAGTGLIDRNLRSRPG